MSSYTSDCDGVFAFHHARFWLFCRILCDCAGTAGFSATVRELPDSGGIRHSGVRARARAQAQPFWGNSGDSRGRGARIRHPTRPKSLVESPSLHALSAVPLYQPINELGNISMDLDNDLQRVLQVCQHPELVSILTRLILIIYGVYDRTLLTSE
jgi:hypothetical protein